MFHILLLAVLLITGSGSLSWTPDRPLPTLSSLTLLCDARSNANKSADSEALIILSATCPACRRLAQTIATNYSRMDMKVTALLIGTRGKAQEFIDIVNPPYEVRYAEDIKVWANYNTGKYPYIIISDKKEHIVSVDAAASDLH